VVVVVVFFLETRKQVEEIEIYRVTGPVLNQYFTKSQKKLFQNQKIAEKLIFVTDLGL
jgi:hypothetical protein